MLRRWGVGIFFGVLPALVASILVGHFFTVTLKSALAYGPDEIAYWLQVHAFEEAGLNAGYFNIHERPAAAPFSRFGPHGIGFFVVYGTIAKATGWRPYSAPLVGVVLIGLALAGWATLLRPPAVLTLSVIATFWPMVIYLPSTMQEPLHYAIAVACAAALWRTAAGASPAEIAGWAGVMLACAIIRPTWALAAPALAVVAALSAARWTVRVVVLGGALVAVALAYALFSWLASPYPGSPMALASDVAATPLLTLQRFALRGLRGAGEFVTSEAPVLDLCTRAAAVLVLLTAAARVMRRGAARARHEVAIAVWMGSTLAALTAFGQIDPGRDIRVLGPAVFVALLVWAAANDRRLLAAALAIQLAVAPWGIDRFYRMHVPRFTGDHTRHLQFQREIRDVVRFEPGAPPWRNTILAAVETVQDQAMLGLPAGMGVSAVLDWEAIEYPPHSRFVLAGPRERAMMPGSFQPQRRQRTILGTLYENSTPSAR